jgi:hypothetical protein
MPLYVELHSTHTHTHIGSKQHIVKDCDAIGVQCVMARTC